MVLTGGVSIDSERCQSHMWTVSQSAGTNADQNGLMPEHFLCPSALLFVNAADFSTSSCCNTHVPTANS